MKIENIDAYTSRKTTRPVEGDIFFGENEFVIGRFKNENKDVVEVCVTNEMCIKEGVRTEKMFSKGLYVEFPVKTQTDISSIDETRKSSMWVVEKTEYRESLQLIHSVLPETYLVVARRLKDNKYDENSEVIEFYTCGGQLQPNLYKGNLEVVGKLVK